MITNHSRAYIYIFFYLFAAIAQSEVKSPHYEFPEPCVTSRINAFNNISHSSEKIPLTPFFKAGAGNDV